LLTLSHCVMWLSVASYILVFFLLCTRRPPLSPLFPYTTLFRSRDLGGSFRSLRDTLMHIIGGEWGWLAYWKASSHSAAFLADLRSEEHTSELQSRFDLVCRLLLEKKKASALTLFVLNSCPPPNY